MIRASIITTLLVSILGVTLFFGCSSSPVYMADGSSSETVIGSVINLSGDPAPHTEVKLIPIGYNPTEINPQNAILVDTTDSLGNYRFTLSDTGLYNIEALHLSQLTQAFVSRIRINSDTTLVTDATLYSPGKIEIIFSDTISTSGRFVYIPGTTVFKGLEEGSYLNEGGYSLILDPVVAAELPEIVVTQKNQDDLTMLVATPVLVTSSQTIVINITSGSSIKPLWLFSLVVGVSAQTVLHHGGIDSVRKLTEKYVGGINSKFNNPGVLNGFLRFTFDSLYQFSRNVLEEKYDTVPGFDYRLLIDRFSDWNYGGWYHDTRTICRAMGVANTSNIFGQSSIDVAAWEFGQARGCIPLSWIEVDAANNPINGSEFRMTEVSIMNWPYGVNRWDELSVNMINYYADAIYYSPGIINRAFPASMGVTVNSATGEPLSGTDLTFYGIKLNGNSVESSPIFSGITDSTGEYTFSQNPYNPDSEQYIKYYNILIRAIHQSDTVFTWKPVFDAANAWFANPDSTYRMIVHF